MVKLAARNVPNASSLDLERWEKCTLYDVERVLYKHGSVAKPLCRLLYCRFCNDLRYYNSDLIQVEVDSHYCMHALDNVPTTEAIMKKNRSRSYWQCPACPSVLTQKQAWVIEENPEKPEEPFQRKTHFMQCPFCHWSTRDLGIPDAPTAGSWPEKENLNQSRINELYEYTKQLSLQQASFSKSKASRKITKVAGRIGGFSPMLLNYSMRDDGNAKKKPIELENPKTRTLEELDDLPEEYLSEDGLDFWKTTSLKQRFDQPEYQPELTKDLYPRRLTMGVKRSLRCRQCDHNLLKPEFSPSSIKYKMHLIATSFIPEIRLFKPSVFSTDKLSANVYLTVTNPTHSSMNIILLPFCEEENENSSFPKITGKIILPADSYEIPAKDTLLDYSCLTKSTENLEPAEDGKIVFPQPNKIAFNCTYQSDGTGDSEGDSEKWVALRIKHDTVDQKQQSIWISHVVFIKISS